jgi:hypothetical protein
VIAKTGQPWSEVLKMDALTRKAYLYVHAVQEGMEVNWSNGEIRAKNP